MMYSSLRNFRPYAILALFATGLLFLAGCGGSSGGSDSGGSSYIAAPASLIGGTLVLTYSDGRSYTLVFNNSTDTGVTRSDGKTTTAWTTTGLGSAVLGINLFYGTIATGDAALDNVFDGYALAFSTKTTGDFSLKENTTANNYSNTPVISGTFSFTTYPPNG